MKISMFVGSELHCSTTPRQKNKRSIEVNFTHLNGKLTLNDFKNESKLQNVN